MKKSIKFVGLILSILLLMQSFFFVSAKEDKPILQFNKDGKFTIIQISDTQDTHDLSLDTLSIIESALDTYKPDLVVFTGDQIEGYCSTFIVDTSNKAKKAIDAVVAPMVKRNIPFVVTFGNHDDQCGISKEQQMKWYSSYPNCLSFDEGDKLEGCGTNNFVVKSSDGTKDVLNIYAVDSMGDAPGGGYLGATKGQIEFCKNVASELKQKNNGEVVPAVLFQHVPVQEIYDSLLVTNDEAGITGYRDFSDKKYELNKDTLVGKTDNYVLGEGPCPSNTNNGQFQAWLDAGDVFAAYFGHDHKNNFASKYKGIDLGYCPTSGFNSYGDNLNRGVRVLEFDENNVKDYNTFTAYYADLVGTEVSEPVANFISQNTTLSFENFKFVLPFILIGCALVIASIVTIVVVIVKKRKKS